MIKSLYVFNQNGVLLYSKVIEDQGFDKNLLIGFFTSVANFSREALHSSVKKLNLGANNKLILSTFEKEKILSAAIVGPRDNDKLVENILTDITLDFINLYSPDYRIESIDQSEMNKIIKNNTRGKTIQEPLRRYLITYAILIPLSLLFTFITIPAVELFFNLFFPGDLIYGGDELFTIFMPLLYILGSIILLIVFPFPNFISGFLISDRKLAFINSILLLILTNIWYVLLAQVNFAFAIISNLPMSIITSLFFAYYGYRVSSRRRLFQK